MRDSETWAWSEDCRWTRSDRTELPVWQQLLWCRRVSRRTSEMFTFGSRAAAVEDESRAVLSSPPFSHSASVLSIIHHVVQMSFTRSQRAHVQNLQNRTRGVTVTFVRRVVSLHQGQLWMTGITQLIKTKKIFFKLNFMSIYLRSQWPIMIYRWC